MSVNVCLDDIFRTTEQFDTKLGMVMHHHEPDCHAQKKCLLSPRSRSQWGLIWSKCNAFYYIFWTAESSTTKLGLIIRHHKAECQVKKLDYCSQGHREGSKCQCLSRYLLNPKHFVINLKFWCIAGVSCEKVGLLFSRSGSQRKGSYNENMTVYTIFSELLILLPPNCCCFLIGYYHRPECLMKLLDCCVLDYGIQDQGHSRGSKCQYLSRWYPLNHQTFCNQTWYCYATSWARVSCKKDWFAIFKVKVTAWAHMIKIWQFLLHFLSCWSFCYQTLFDSLFSWARVSYEDIKLLCLRSRSKENLLFIQMIFSELLKLSLSNLVWWCLIMSQIVLKNYWFAVFKVKVTVKDHLIKILLSNISS